MTGDVDRIISLKQTGFSSHPTPPEVMFRSDFSATDYHPRKPDKQH